MTFITKRQLVEFLAACGLVAAAVAWRLYNHEHMIMPNLELVTAAAFIAGVYLHRYYAVIVPLAALFISDRVIGNNDMAWFVWSAFLVISLSGLYLRRYKAEPEKLVVGTAGMGLGAAVFFFMWTNFGVWLMGDGSFYPHTWAGLMECYTMALPFFRATLMSGVVVAPAAMAVVVYVPRLVESGRQQLARV